MGEMIREILKIAKANGDSAYSEFVKKRNRDFNDNLDYLRHHSNLPELKIRDITDQILNNPDFRREYIQSIPTETLIIDHMNKYSRIYGVCLFGDKSQEAVH